MLQPVREGRILVKEGQLLPLRLEFYQNGGVAHMRLYWSWKGRARELVPATAFFHAAADEQNARAIMRSGRAAAGSVLYTNRALVYGTREHASTSPAEPIVLKPGPHLFLDDYLIEVAKGVTRKVCSPSRDPRIPNPIVTAKEDRCFQPFFTVSRSPETGKFRIWYGAWRDDRCVSRSHLAYLESDDGVRWQRPAKVLKDPGELQFGSEVLDEGPKCRDPARRYVYCWWYGGGMRIATSPNGFDFTPISPGVVLPHGHDITNLWRDPIRNRLDDRALRPGAHEEGDQPVDLVRAVGDPGQSVP